MAAAARDYIADLAQHIGHLLGWEKGDAGEESEGLRLPHQGGRVFGEVDAAQFQEQVRKVFAHGGQATGGAVHFLGLGRLRAHFGARWPKILEKVNAIACAAIERRLTEKDLYTLYRDEGYIIVFAGLSKEAAQLKCGLMAQEISKRLVGSHESRHIDIATVTVDEAGGVSSETVTVAQLFKRVVAGERVAGTEVEVPAGGAAAASDRSATETPPIPGSTEVEGAPEGVLGDAERPLFFAPEKIQFVYRPMWQVRRKVVSAYICVPTLIDADGRIRFGGAAMPLTHASPENAALDSLTARKVFEDLGELAENNRKLILVAPVHYITVNDPDSGRAYADLCGTLAEGLRNLLVFELIGTPKGVSSSALMNALSRLKPFSRAVLIRLRLDNKDFSRFKGTGVYGVGADVGNVPLPEERLFKSMERFNKLAHLSGLTTYVHGLRSLSLISSAAGAGFGFIDGDPVMSVIDMPQSVSPFDVENLYASLLDGAG